MAGTFAWCIRENISIVLGLVR